MEEETAAVEIDEALLIQRARQGDSQAFVEIYERCYPPVFRYVFYRVGGQEAAEDLASEVFVRMVAGMPRFQPKGRPILAWLYTIARNLVTDYHRKNARIELSPLEDDLATSSHNNPEQTAERHFTHNCLRRALTHLTEDQKQMIVLKFIEGREIAEIAAIMNKNERAIRSLQHRALAAMGRAIERERCDEI